MAIDEVNTKLALVALENCEGFPFERFATDFISSIEGANFIPIGGTSDGGADGVYDRGLFNSKKNIDVFYQFSVEKNYRSKIKRTIDRLKEFGRTPQRLIYITSQTIGVFDKEEEALTDLHKVFIRIRDAKWILANLNSNESTKKAYYTHLSHYTDFLRDINNGQNIKVNNNISHPSVYVFLQQQVENREKDKHLTKTVADSLILWALNDTDPAVGKFLTRSQILDSITQNIPWAKSIVSSMLNDRLNELVNKGGVGGKKINFYKKNNEYCLPYETREIIAAERANDESLRFNVINELITSLDSTSFIENEKKQIADLAVRVSQLFFEKEGLNCSSFLNGKQQNLASNKLIENTVYDRVIDALNETHLSENLKEKFNTCLCEICRKMFYQSTESQRLLLNKFSRTYVLLFTLQAEPRVIEYFQKATANFRLLVGADLIIRALTERFLSKENQMTRNLFDMAKSAGIKLILTEPALDGVIKHIIVTDNEYKNHIQPRESYLDIDVIRESRQILIRTYFHTKAEGYTKSWIDFISEFLPHNQIHYANGKEELKTYISQQFNMEYVSREDLGQGVPPLDISNLASKIIDIKKGNKSLADDIALTINAVYGQRRESKEYSTFPEFGYQTWWLTQEEKVQQHTHDIVKKNGAKYIMRPEFLLNFFSLSPSVSDVRESYKTIFPSVMGIQMGNRLPDELFHKVLDQVEIWKNSEDGKIAARTRTLVDRLKSEHFDDSITYYSIDNIIMEANRL